MRTPPEQNRQLAIDAKPSMGAPRTLHRRACPALLLAAVSLVVSINAVQADDTNSALPSVSVQADQNTTVTGTPPGIFTVQRTGDLSQALAVNYSISGTATNGIDYERLTGTVSIPAGESSAPIQVTPIDHRAADTSKNVTVTLAPQNRPFTVVALPDSQFYTAEENGATREIFTAQTRWIVEHKDDSNIVFVLHEGDITDGNTAREWTNAAVSLGALDGVVPYALAVGNHDGWWGSQDPTALFNQFFPLSRYQNLPTFGGAFESNRMDNCYHLFSAGGVDWLVFVFEFGPRNEVLAWANQVAANYPDRRIIMLTHTHIYSDNTLHGSSGNHLWKPTDYGRPNNGTDVWEKFLRRQPNAALTFNGHVLNSGTGRLVGVGDSGNQVFQMLANYQVLALGGAGYLRIVQFFPEQDKMSVSTYSPYWDSWLTDTNNQFAYTNLGIFTNAGPGYLVDAQAASASLIVTNDGVDRYPPEVSQFSYMGVPPVFRVTFDEPVEPDSAQNPANYVLDSGISFTNAVLLTDGRTVALSPDASPGSNQICTLTVDHVKDCAPAPNEMSVAATWTFTYQPTLLADRFAEGDLAGWIVLDQVGNSPPSQWQLQSGRLAQLSNIYGPTATATDHRLGTILYWGDPAAAGWSNYSFSMTFRNGDDDGVGVVFGFRDPGNYYKVDLDSQRNFRKLFQVTEGVETTLAADAGGYVPGIDYTLNVKMTGDQINVSLNGTVLFGGAVTDAGQHAGTVGLYSWASQGVFFNNVRVAPLPCLPAVAVTSPTNGATLVQPETVVVAVNATAPQGSIAQVRLWCGTLLLTTLTNAPYQFPWTNPPPGNYTLTAEATADAGQTAVSSPVGFTVVPPSPGPALTQQPSDQTVHAGSEAMFCVRASSAGPLNYQWQFNGAPISGATNAFLLLGNVQLTDAGSYTVTVSNPSGGTVSQPATLAVNTAAPLLSQTNGPPELHFTGLEALAPGVVLVSLAATNLSTARIDWSSNCVDWVPLLTLTNYNDPLYFIDADVLNQPCRFYRAAALP